MQSEVFVWVLKQPINSIDDSSAPVITMTSVTNGRTIDFISDEELGYGKWSKDGLYSTANRLVAVPRPAGGLLAIGCHSIIYSMYQSTH